MIFLIQNRNNLNVTIKKTSCLTTVISKLGKKNTSTVCAVGIGSDLLGHMLSGYYIYWTLDHVFHPYGRGLPASQ